VNVGAILILATQGLTLLAALISFIQSSRNAKAIQEVHISLNSRLSELLKETEKSSHAAGLAEGILKNQIDNPV
jgi:hypothetical protein